MTSFYSQVATPALFTIDTTRRQVTGNRGDTQNTWVAGRDPSDQTKDSWCKRAFGPEFSYDGTGTDLGFDWGGRSAHIWTPNCTHNGTRAGDLITCCNSLGANSGSSAHSCPGGTNIPASQQCAAHWINRCNNESGLADSNICRVVYDSLADKSAMKPFLRARVSMFGAQSAQNISRDPWTKTQLERKENSDVTKSVCNNSTQFAANAQFCKKWCAENAGECDTSAAAYCAQNNTDPFCGCFGTYHLYHSDPALNAMLKNGMTRCSDPCLAPGAYVTASGTGINQCCAQFNNISLEQRALIAGNSLANNLVMNCGGTLPAPAEIPIQNDDTRKRNLIIIFILLIIVVVIVACGIGAYFYFSSEPNNNFQSN